MSYVQVALCISPAGQRHRGAVSQRNLKSFYSGSPAGLEPARSLRHHPSPDGKNGKREFVQVVRLMEAFRQKQVIVGIEAALERGTIGFDAVKHLVLCHVERRPPRLDITVYPYLPKAHVAATSPGNYLRLLAGAYQ